MTAVILPPVITGLVSIIVTVITILATSKKQTVAMQTKMEVSNAVFNERIDSLTREVRKHNSFAERLPVVEEKIKVINHRIEDLEKKVI